MTYWLAEAAKEVRLAQRRKLVHIASELSRSESTLSRFEHHLNVPGDIDATIAAYARDLDLKPIEIWERALELWRGAPDDLSPEEDVDEIVEEIEREEPALDRPDAGRQRTEAGAPAKGRTQADAGRSR